jgi:hypothetical protein
MNLVSPELKQFVSREAINSIFHRVEWRIKSGEFDALLEISSPWQFNANLELGQVDFVSEEKVCHSKALRSTALRYGEMHLARRHRTIFAPKTFRFCVKRGNNVYFPREHIFNYGRGMMSKLSLVVT